MRKIVKSIEKQLDSFGVIIENSNGTTFLKSFEELKMNDPSHQKSIIQNN
jgi:hypothetical protein